MIMDELIRKFRQIKLLFLRNNFITYLYFNKYGVKCSNIIIRNQTYKTLNSIILPPDKLFLDVDFLRDEYTLCDCPLIKSPHFDLMKALVNSQSIEETEYCRRATIGTLDSRTSQNISFAFIDSLHKTYKSRFKEITEDSYRPIDVYKVGERYYIVDGKHRAALCAYLGKAIQCNIISSDCMKDSYYAWNYEKMKNKPDLFSHNIKFIENILFDNYGK